jgi:hypothetical protein
MLGDVFGIIANSGIELVFRHGALLIAASLLCLLAIRLVMSLLSAKKEKARKHWEVEPAAGDDPSLIARLLGCKEGTSSQDLLNEDVKLLLEQCAKRAQRVNSEEREPAA